MRLRHADRWLRLAIRRERFAERIASVARDAAFREHDRIPVLVRALRRDTVGAVRAVSGRVVCVAARAGAVRFSHRAPRALRGASMEATALREQLCAAIRRRSLVMFEYGDLIRVVEPHRFGVNSAGHEMLSGWLRAGYSRSDPAGGWRNYLLSDVSALQLLDAPFAGTRPGYVAHDPRMREVYCELVPSAADARTEGPFIVQEPSGTTPPSPATEPTTEPAATSEPIEHPVEAARTRDGEADPPGAMP
jgi:hypothetical protein